jgi:flagella basal body P-ring formation protein FlgA
MAFHATEDVCVERGSAVLSREELESALVEALVGTNAEFRLLDFSRMPVPRGKLEFRRSGLVVPRGAQVDVPVIWRGRILYSPTRSVSVWAKVTMSVERKRVTATHDLPIGQPIQAEQIQLEQVSEFPFGEACARTIEEVAGKVPRRSLRRGETVRLALLTLPREVQRGDTVEVAVASGTAHLNFQGIAESGGRQGDRVLVKNPENGQRFAAQVESKGKVSVNTERKSNARH